MINLVFVKKCCKDYTKIENYEEAVNDTTQTWICHHILGEILSREHKRHIGLASKGRKLKSPSVETRRKMSEARKRYLAKKRGEV